MLDVEGEEEVRETGEGGTDSRFRTLVRFVWSSDGVVDRWRGLYSY